MNKLLNRLSNKHNYKIEGKMIKLLKPKHKTIKDDKQHQAKLLTLYKAEYRAMIKRRVK